MTLLLKKMALRILRLFSLSLRPIPPRFLQTLPQHKIVQHLLPSGKTLVCERYLGLYRVSIDTTYPIERAMFSGIYDEYTQRVIRTMVKRGDTCIDIGANVGAISFGLATAVGSDGKVYALEPGPIAFERLRRNVSLNPCVSPVVIPVQIGISDQKTIMYWREDPRNRGNASLSHDNGVPVEVVPLDRFVQDYSIEDLSFVKIDVEGMELKVIKGGLGTIRRFRPTIYYESLLTVEDHLKEKIYHQMETLLRSEGYALFKLDTANRLNEVHYPNLPADTIAIPVEKIGGYRTL